jgi:cytochrome P450
MHDAFSSMEIMLGKGLLATLGLPPIIVLFSLTTYLCMEYEGDQHRKQRKMLNPAFSTTQIRQMSKNIENFSKKTSRPQLSDSSCVL